MRRKGPVGVQRERRALEHQFVLAADLVQIDERQPAFDDARHRDAFANGELVAFVRGGVGDQQDFAAGLEDAFDRVGAPDVLADRHADAHPAKDDRPRRRPRRKHALLVKNAIIGQIDLEAHRFDAPAVEERHRVKELAVLDPGQAHQRGGPAVGRQAREILAGGAASLLKRRLQHQVLGRIAGEEQFRRHHEVGPEGRGLRARLTQTVAVARDVADDRWDLRERYDETIGGINHDGDLARGGRRAQTRGSSSLAPGSSLQYSHISNRRADPFPSLLGKVARSAGWGVARCFGPSRIARPSPQTCIDP